MGYALTILSGGVLLALGIHPRDVSGLYGIILAPFLHAGLAHLLGNSIYGLFFGFLVALSGRRAYWEVTAICILAAGGGTWLIGGVGTNHVGASGVVFGWLAYLITRGFFNRSLSQSVLGVVLGYTYFYWIGDVLPTTAAAGVSWQGHLCGAIGGIIAAAVITSDDPPGTVARRQQAQLRAQQQALRQSQQQFRQRPSGGPPPKNW